MIRQHRQQQPYQYQYIILFLFLSCSSISGNYGGRNGEDDQLCHSNCNCLDTFFQCSRLTSTFPLWINKLNISNIGGTLEPRHLVRLLDLDTLYLDGNNLTTIPEAINSLVHLTHLSLSRNNIHQLAHHTLPPKLTHLDLSRNLISSITPPPNNSNSFQPSHSSLATLNLASNAIESLESGSFTGLSSLLELSLAKNRLRSIPKDAFKPLSSLERLDLSRNRLDSLDSIQFQGLRKLKELNLKRNHLSSLSDGAFYELDSIQHLFLDWNAIRLVEKRWLYGLRALRTLTLSHNELLRIEDDGWEYTEELSELDLSHNQLVRLSRRAFGGLLKLNTLTLASNALDEVEEGTFSSLSDLHDLDLSGNELSWVVEDMSSPFKGLAEVKTLNLGSNRIRSIHADAFKGLGNLKWLNISSNPLSWFPPTPFTTLANIELSMSNVGSLVCDCHIGWLQSHLAQLSRRFRHHNHANQKVFKTIKTTANKQATNTQTVLCAHPKALAGSPLTDVDPSQLTCSPYLEKPILIQQPKSQVFLMEGRGQLECIVETFANNSLDIQWRKNYAELPTHLDANVKTSKSLISDSTEIVRIGSTLELSNISWTDGGRYQCIIQTQLGPLYSKPANITIHIFPAFVKKPSNVSVRLGSNAKLECGAKGFPSPEIAFQKDDGEDFPAALERRFHVMPNDDSFFIMEVKLSDMGVYSCSARNAAGAVKSYATVTVYETPSFATRMQDEASVEGSNAILECLASGSPKPIVSWSKDGRPVVEDRKKFQLTENGSLLVVKDVEAGDSGRYECTLTNAVGTARGFSTLTVLPAAGKTSLNLDNAAMTVIFIIIAVFCVVGTSAAWVVVIYRTRQRSNSKSNNKSMSNSKSVEFESSSTPLRSKFDESITGPMSSSTYPLNPVYHAVGSNSKSVLLVNGAGDGGSQSSASSKDSGTGEEAFDGLGEKNEVDGRSGRGRSRPADCGLTTFGTPLRQLPCQPQLQLQLQQRMSASAIENVIVVKPKGPSSSSAASSSLSLQCVNNSNGREHLLRVCIPVPPPQVSIHNQQSLAKEREPTSTSTPV